mmetsp:Transcript_14141/g.18438  ORF Transcript_14141/g.18438 Transcript_14141/m.18438 type:complete len:141 (+) Transcript_14141:97-519(+)
MIPMNKATLQTPPIHVLRGIYRLLKTPKLAVDMQKKSASAAVPLMRPTAMQTMLFQRYRLNAAMAGDAEHHEVQHLRAMAVQYHNLKLDLRERARLYKLDAGVEEQLTPKEMSRRAAARAGLQMPDLSAQMPDLSASSIK